MKAFLLALICIVISISALPAQAKKKHPPVSTPAPAAQSPGERLSKFLGAHLEEVLSPLDGRGFTQPEQIVELREYFADAMAQSSPDTKPIYQASMIVCDALSQAATERTKAVASLASSSKVNGDSSLGAIRKDHAGWLEQDREKREQKQRNQQAAKTDSFFTAGQKEQWIKRAAQLRQNIDQLYAREREIERQVNATPPPPKAPSPPANP